VTTDKATVALRVLGAIKNHAKPADADVLLLHLLVPVMTV